MNKWKESEGFRYQNNRLRLTLGGEFGHGSDHAETLRSLLFMSAHLQLIPLFLAVSVVISVA